jgi:hypothetical protein
VHGHMTWDLRTQHNPHHGGRETRGYPPYGRVYVCVCVYVCVWGGWGGQRVHPCQRVPRLHMFPVDRPVTTWYRAGGWPLHKRRRPMSGHDTPDHASIKRLVNMTVEYVYLWHSCEGGVQHIRPCQYGSVDVPQTLYDQLVSQSIHANCGQGRVFLGTDEITDDNMRDSLGNIYAQCASQLMRSVPLPGWSADCVVSACMPGANTMDVGSDPVHRLWVETEVPATWCPLCIGLV